MSTLRCHVAVVGAGPAGSSAALAAAAAGAEVLLLERRRVVGAPVRCAEYIPAPLTGMLEGEGYVCQRIHGMQSFLEGERMQRLEAPGFTIRRDLFDQALAAEAVKAGARLLTDSFVLARDGKALEARRQGERLRVEADVVIGADGPHSRVGRWIGSVNSRCLPAIQMQARLAQPLADTEFYFSEDFPHGYGWLFPKGDIANVGVGMTRQSPAHLYAALDTLLHRLTESGKILPTARALTGGGWVPAAAPRSIVRGDTLLAGDAAGYTHAITGGGVYQAVIGGRMAGAWAAKAALEGDPTLLGHYEEEWNDCYGETLMHAYERRELLEAHTGPLREVFKRCWVGFREYYADL